MNTLQKALLASSVLFIVSCGGSEEDPGPPPIYPLNYPPEAVDDDVTVSSNTSTAINVVANDIDEGDYTLTLQEVGEAEFGSVVIENNQALYTPTDDFTGVDTFTYVVSDEALTDTGTVTVTVVNGMSVSGRVVDAPIAGATVTATVGEETFTTTADSNGYYNLDIGFTDGSQLLTISAQGAEANEQAYVTLVSMLPNLDELYQAAGDDRVLQRSETSGTYVTNLTTASYTLVAEINNGAPPETTEELNKALEAIDPNELMEIAAVIKLIVDNPNYDLPEGQTSIREFVANTAAYNAFVNEVETNTPEALTNVVDEILADEQLIAASTGVPDFYIQTYPTQPGYIAKGYSTLKFNDNGTGEALTEGAREIMNRAFTWQLQDNGYVTITYDEPVTGGGLEFLQDATDDPELLDTFEAAGIYQIPVTVSFPSQRFKVISSGPRYDTVRSIQEYTYTYDPVVVNGVEYQMPARTQKLDQPVMFINGDKLNRLQITAADVSGKWALPVLALFNGDTVVSRYGSDLITFNDDFTFTGQLSGIEGSWELYQGTSIQMWYDDVQLTIQFVDQQDGIYGALVKGETGDGTKLIAHEWAARQTDELSWDTSTLLTAADEVWLPSVDLWSSVLWDNATDQPLINSFYSWQFETAERGWFSRIRCGFGVTCFYGDDENEPTENQWSGRSTRWLLKENNELQIQESGSCSNQFPSDCQLRDMIPLQIDNENESLLVLENGSYSSSPDPADPYYSLFPPRVNYLQKVPFPGGISNPYYADGGNSAVGSNAVEKQRQTRRVGFLPEPEQPLPLRTQQQGVKAIQ